MEVEFKNKTLKFLEKLDKDTNIRIIKKIELLKIDPFPRDMKRVIGHKEKVFRVRVGSYRILYRVNYQNNKVIIIKIDKRTSAY